MLVVSLIKLIDMTIMSAKNLDGHGRFRSETIGFRLSPEENEQINFAVGLSGMTKQDYIVSKLLDREIVVQGNTKIQKFIYLAFRV